MTPDIKIKINPKNMEEPRRGFSVSSRIRKHIYVIIAIAFLGVAFSIYQNAKADIYGSSLIAWWNMDDNQISGTSVTDVSGTSNTGVLGGSPSTGVAGRIGQGINFDGDDDFLNASTTVGEFDCKEGTFSLWVTQASDTGFQQLINYRIDGNNEVEIADFNGQTSLNLRYAYQVGGVFSKTVNITNLTANNTWHHVAMTWSDTGDNMKAYFDGVQVGTTQTGVGVCSGTLNNAEVGDSIASQNWNGKIDEVRIYNRPLTANEIMALFYQGSSIYGGNY